MIYLNGEKVETIERLEELISSFSEDQKQILRNDFNGIPNTPTYAISPITARQIRLALLGAGVSLQMIDSAISQMPEPQKSYAQITWEYANVFEREHPMIEGLGSQLGLTSEQIDQLFLGASAL